MNSLIEDIFETRQTIVVELPLAPNTRILRPEQIIVKIDNEFFDFGAFCYALRSNKARRRGRPRDVVLSSFLPQRQKQIRQAVKALSALITEFGRRPRTARGVANSFKRFMDWADSSGYHDSLAGGDATRQSYRAYAANVEEGYRQHEFESRYGWRLQWNTCEILQAITGSDDLSRGVRLINVKTSPNGGTEPAGEHDFAHALAINQALFDGICELTLGNMQFPFKLDMPKSLGWNDSFLWIFPGHTWRLPPHLWGSARKDRRNRCWAYDYENGRLATVAEIWHRYEHRTPADRRSNAAHAIRQAKRVLDAANHDSRHRARIMLAMVAQNAFQFLFFANTGVNVSVAQHIETDGEIDSSTLNQNYRTIKCRAQGREVDVVAPAAFMPDLRRFMALRKYLLNGASCPYLFFTLGGSNAKPPTLSSANTFDKQYAVLRGIDPKLPRISARKIRATVEDYYRRNTDSAIAARVIGHSEAVADRNYLAGSPIDHQEDMTLFLNRVSEIAKKQKVVADGSDVGNARSLEEGGRCRDFGHPEAMAEGISIKPDCRQGCLFCANRILIANEEDVRKVASAAFVMEQLILGPQSEADFRPQIQKCDEDLDAIASFDGCRDMVKLVREDVHENGNLTPYFADKYQLFLELGVL